MNVKRLPLVATAAVLAAVACAKRPVPLGPAPLPHSTGNDSLDRARADSVARADSIRQAELARQKAVEDSLNALRAQEQRNAAQNADAMAVLTSKIYFDYDQSMLTDAAQALLTAKVTVLKAQPSIRVRITGNTDERGSSEYNLALGLRRAAEAKAFLVANGIDESRLEILSMGAERPAVEGTGEEVWSKNRRDEFAVITKGDSDR